MEKLNMPVDEFTSPSPISALPKDSLTKVMCLMSENGIRHVPIVSENKAIGIISERDLKVALMVNENCKLLAEDIMVRDLLTTSCNTPLDEVVFEMSSKKIGSAVVEDDKGDLYGIFTSTDALNALIEISRGTVQ